MSNNDKYIQETTTGDVYKIMPTHYLKMSPWHDGDDRRVYEIDNENCHVISFQNACMIVNKQFNETNEQWEFRGKKYTAAPVPQTRELSEQKFILKSLPSHHAIQKSEQLLDILPNHTITLTSVDDLTELKMVKHKGKVYYILIINEFLPKVKAYDVFGKFAQWCNIKNCKPIFNVTDEHYM